ncbi:myrcene synthase [Quercus suber]|uniref:Myrcene synthase n=1 Tax=Quercus suber TaxID=58331 RepID=A0AAW0L614_QUESU
MALNVLASLPIYNFPSKGPIHLKSLVTISRSGMFLVLSNAWRTANSKSTDIVRRSAIIKLLFGTMITSMYTGKINKLKGQARMMLQKVVDPLEQLELIDILQKLGLSYLLSRILEGLYNNDHDGEWKKENLYATALKFQLLRQHGYRVSKALRIPIITVGLLSAEVFDSFMEEGSFKGYLWDDTKGILSLYEASFLWLEEEAREFSKKHLQEFINQNKDQNLSIIVSHTLELPHTGGYQGWWRSIGLAEKLSFANREFLLDSGVYISRRISTKVNLLITVIDDIYDVYGTLDELDLFTNAVESWNINVMDGLLDYMKLCFLALHNSVNEMAFDTLKIAWMDICRAYLLEAKWYYTGYLQESNNKGRLINFLEECPNIVCYSSIIVRLARMPQHNELERGGVPKSIQCYMNENGASEEDAREYIRHLISETWKKMNEERDATSSLLETFIEIIFNLRRMAQCMY